MAALEKAHLRMANLRDGLAVYFDEEIICEGSDAEDSPHTKVERQKRREAIALRYLQGHAPLIMSAQLRGPFDKESGWINPWRSKREIQKKPTKRARATEHQSLGNNTTAVDSGKHRRNDSNSSGYPAMRAEALSERSNTSIDIVKNRQLEQPDIYSGFKSFASTTSKKLVDSAKQNGRENISQHPNASIKRRADSNWLKGADVRKRPRNDWLDPTSPTPKDRPRDIIGSDKGLIDSSGISTITTKNYNRQVPAETLVLPPLEDSPSRPDFEQSKCTTARRRRDDNTRYTTPNRAGDIRHTRSIMSDPVSKNQSIGGKGASNNERQQAKSAFKTDNGSEDGSDPSMEIGRTAPGSSLKGSSFAEPLSSLRHKLIQSHASVSSVEPSPVRTFSRDQLDQKVLHGLSQASRLARAAERLAPMKQDDPKLNIMERSPSDVAKQTAFSFSSAKKPPQEVAAASSSYALDASSHSRPPPRNPTNVEIARTKKSHQLQSVDSPLPPSSFTYRRVRRKTSSPVNDEEDSDPDNIVNKQNRSPEAALSLPIQRKDDTHRKEILSPRSRVLDQTALKQPQPFDFNSPQHPFGRASTAEAANNDIVRNYTPQPVDRDFSLQMSIQASAPLILPTTIMEEVSKLERDTDDFPKLIINGRGNEGSFVALAMSIQENEEIDEQQGQQIFRGQSPPRNAVAEETNNEHTEEREADPLSKVPENTITRDSLAEEVKLSQGPCSQLAGPVQTDNETTLGQEIQSKATKKPTSTSRSPKPDFVEDNQSLDSSFMPATENVDSISAPQSPWTAEEVVPAPLSSTAKSTTNNRHFSMSQSKDAAILLMDPESHAADSHQSNEINPSRYTISGSSLTDPDPTTNMLYSKHSSLRKATTPQSATVGNVAFLSPKNPWANNSQSPTKQSRSAKPKKRVSFSPMQLSNEELRHLDQLSDSKGEPKDLSSPPPSSGAEILAEGEDKFHKRLKWTKEILTVRASKGLIGSVTKADTSIPNSPGVGAMAEAFLAADAKNPSRDTEYGETHDKSIVAGSWNFDNLIEDNEQQSDIVTAPTVPAIPLMTESQMVNPWGDEDEVPPFSMTDCGTERGEEDGLVEGVLGDMDAMLGDWDVDAELERAKKEGRKHKGRKTTARERLAGGKY